MRPLLDKNNIFFSWARNLNCILKVSFQIMFNAWLNSANLILAFEMHFVLSIIRVFTTTKKITKNIGTAILLFFHQKSRNLLIGKLVLQQNSGICIDLLSKLWDSEQWNLHKIPQKIVLGWTKCINLFSYKAKTVRSWRARQKFLKGLEICTVLNFNRGYPNADISHCATSSHQISCWLEWIFKFL